MSLQQRRALKDRLAKCELTIGSWLSFGFTPTCEMMAKAGFDWLVIDMEHTAIGIGDQLRLIQIIELAGCVPLVRVGANDPLLINRALDAGAHGVLVPMVNSVADARRAVAGTYYPPRGQRGAGLGRAHSYGQDFAGYKERADRETVLIVQTEHVTGVDALEEILSVDGIDGFIIGPYDLSGSISRPGAWEDPSLQEVLERVEQILVKASKPGGFHVVHSDRRELIDRIERGYRFVAYGDDMVFLSEKLQDEIGFLDREVWKRKP